MDIDERVDRLIYKKEEPVNDGQRLKRWHLFLLFVVMASLGGVVAIPFFQRKEGGFDAQELLVDELNKNKQDLGAEPLNGSAYDYWYAPSGSFGINQTKDVNFTFWRSWLKKYFSYELEARQNNESQWQNANELMNVSLLFNPTNNTCKVTLTLNTSAAPRSLFYRFTLIANRSVISHVNKSVDYEYTLNLSANATENYSLVYNYSDLVPYIQSGVITIKQGIHNNYFYQRIKTNKRIAVDRTIVIDPNFGHETTGTSGQAFLGDIWYSEATPGSGGICTSITAYVSAAANQNMRAALYFDSNESFAFQTEEKVVNTGGAASYEWIQFNCSNTIYLESYHICIWAAANNMRFAAGGTWARDKTDYTSDYSAIDPLPNDGGGANTVCVYATYEVDEPSASWQSNYSGFLSGGNITNFVQNYSGFLTGGNATVSWRSNYSGWCSGGNISGFIQNYSGWISGGNISKSWRSNYSGWLSGGNSTEVIILHPGVYFDIESDTERYGANQTMILSQIVINDTWIMFNDTDFNITAPNFINISLTYIDATPLVSTVGDMILGFWVNSSAGTVYFNISGFEINASYYVVKDSVNYTNANSNATGIINFTDTVNDNRLYEIYNGTMAVPGKTWQSNYSGWLTGGNTSVFIQNYTGWLSGGNITTGFTQNYSGWLTGGNISGFIQNYTGWLTGGNISANRTWQSNYTGWLTGGNNTDWVQNYSGWLTGGNVSKVWQSNYSGWLTGGNVSLDAFRIENEYPTNTSTGVCPCDDRMGVEVSSRNGTAMNITFYRSNYVDQGFYQVATGIFYNVTNGTYTFCINDYDFPHIVGHSHTQDNVTVINTWYNITFEDEHNNGFVSNNINASILYDGMYTMNYWVSVEDTSANPTGNIMAMALFNNGVEIDGSYREVYFTKQHQALHMIGEIHGSYGLGDNISFRYIGDDTDQSVVSNSTWSTDNINAYSSIVKDDSIVMEYNQTYYWYVNITAYGDSSTYNESPVYEFTTAEEPCVSGGGGASSTNTGSIMALAAGAFCVAVLALMYGMKKKKKRR